MANSVEYPPTRSGVKRGLRAIKCSQNRAAAATGQSPAIVSMVLNGKAKSQPCLAKLAAYINSQIAATVPVEAQAS